MRRRRFFTRGSKGSKRERSWVHKSFEVATHPETEVAFFELLGRDDYLEGDNIEKTEHLTLLRTLGRFEFDVTTDVNTQGYNSCSISASLAVISNTAVENAIAASNELQYDPTNTLLGTRGRLLHEFFTGTFTNSIFQDIVSMTTIYMPVSTGWKQDPAVEWDVKQKVRMKSDDALWLIVRGTILQTGEHSWFSVGQSRTLWLD